MKHSPNILILKIHQKQPVGKVQTWSFGLAGFCALLNRNIIESVNQHIYKGQSENEYSLFGQFWLFIFP